MPTPSSGALSHVQELFWNEAVNVRPTSDWILRSLRAGVPLLGEPSFRVGVSHRAVAG